MPTPDGIFSDQEAKEVLTKHEGILSLLPHVFSQKRIVLDLGCGVGYCCERLKAEGYMIFRHDIAWGDTRFFWLDRDHFDWEIRPNTWCFNDYYGVHIEHMFYHCLKQHKELEQPVFIGRNGHDGAQYDMDYDEPTKAIAHDLLSKIDPKAIPC